MNSTQKRLAVTVEEAAEMLSISRSGLYQMISSGEIPSFTIGRSRRVPVQALQSFVEKQVQLAQEDLGIFATAS